MVFIMITLKIVLNITDERTSATALSLIALIKTLGGVFFANISGNLSDRFGMHIVFIFLLGCAIIGLMIASLIHVSNNRSEMFQAKANN